MRWVFYWKYTTTKTTTCCSDDMTTTARIHTKFSTKMKLQILNEMKEEGKIFRISLKMLSYRRHKISKRKISIYTHTKYGWLSVICLYLSLSYFSIQFFWSVWFHSTLKGNIGLHQHTKITTFSAFGIQADSNEFEIIAQQMIQKMPLRHDSFRKIYSARQFLC